MSTTSTPPRALATPALLRPLTLRSLTLRNRIVVSPMCQYCCEAQDGLATDWHLVHLGSRAVGGAALVFTEAAAVSPEGRISPQDLGFWSDQHTQALERTVTFVKAQGAAMGIQLAHAGRKASTSRPWEGHHGVPDDLGGWQPIGPTTSKFQDNYRLPRAMTLGDIDTVIESFRKAAQRADQLGIDVIEIHAAHGYLLHEFMSPLANTRDDGYGGSFDHRVRLTIEVAQAIRSVWPTSKPLFVRISATDWAAGGWDLPSSIELARRMVGAGVDVVDCSSGGLTPLQEVRPGPGYQVPFSEAIRREAHIATAAVGLITTAQQAEAVLDNGQADLIVMARELLRDPYFPLHAGANLGDPDAGAWPVQYVRAKPAR